jgi:hypothetical protein
MARCRPLCTTGEEFVGAREYMFVAKGIVDGSQH